jgi:hypothetical protein
VIEQSQAGESDVFPLSCEKVEQEVLYERGLFGSGEIHAFNAVTGMWEAGMLDQNGAMLSIDGLWGLTFGNNARAGSAIELYFTAGPHNESQGILGKLVPVSSEQRGSAE